MDVFQERWDAVIRTVPGFTSIVDDALAKEDSEIYQDIAVLSLLETVRGNNHKFNADKV